MAYNNFTKLTARKKGALVSQINKLITYYSQIFPLRERAYIDRLTKEHKSIYWTENDLGKLTAVALVEPKYKFSASGIAFQTVSFTISKIPGQMERILSHIWRDYEDLSLMLLCRQTLADNFINPDFNLVRMTPLDLQQSWTELAGLETDFFNSRKDTLAQGMDRKGYNAYFKFSDKDVSTLKNTNPDLWSKVTSA